jgi:hypothetical protein
VEEQLNVFSGVGAGIFRWKPGPSSLSWHAFAAKIVWISQRWEESAIFTNLVVDGESRSRFIDSVSKN